MISFKKLALKDIDMMRIEHLTSLPECQDLFLELQIPYAEAGEFSHTGNVIGYAIVKGSVMLEFSVKSTFQPDFGIYFPEMVKICGVDSILVQSFDQVLFTCCSRLYPYLVVGLLYRDFTMVKIPENPGISFRLATIYDLPFLLMQEDEVFEPKDMITGSIKKDEIILCLDGDTIIGCGFITRIHPLWEYYDIGVWVSPPYRMQGYGTRIVSRLTEICHQNGWTPVCGCGVENRGSERTIEKNGFISNHRLLVFSVTQ